MVEAERRLEDRTTTETRYFISSLPARDARLPRAVRGHWGIGNSLHWVLDIAFREDESRIRTGHAAQTGVMGPPLPPGTAQPIKCDCFVLKYRIIARRTIASECRPCAF